MTASYAALPGADLVEAGLRDLESGIVSDSALPVSIGAPPDPEHRLYERLARGGSDGAHSRYNALIRRLVSFERALACVAVATREQIDRFMHALAAQARHDGRVYVTGGASAVLLGWRLTTIDVDVKLVPEQDALLRAIPALKESLKLNVELASPADFIPVGPEWEERSQFIVRLGPLSFHHFDFCAQALAKVERGHAQDLADVREMLDRALVDGPRALDYFRRIESDLFRYPAIDPSTFKRAVQAAFPPG